MKYESEQRSLSDSGRVECSASHDKLKCIGHSLASSLRVERSVSHDKLMKRIGHWVLSSLKVE